MENNNNNNDTPSTPLCTAGCGFYGNEVFNNMCSQCYKASQQKKTPSSPVIIPPPSTTTTTTTSTSTKAVDDNKQVESAVSSPMSISTPSSEVTLNPRKHLRTPSPEPSALRSSAPPPSISSPSCSSVDVAVDSPSSEKPIQTNKGRCFKCRVKIPLAKQAANKCRCSYVFCDSHRYPDRHDCEVDHAKLDRDILAKNNPKLHERPKGGRSFQRIDSL
ncbi:hypothetical protein K501DRAFT_326823 [Backusella circina FSU 941]|nr:hypothetical protein K501DRAFT_338778 [Backusella circina FSU 941]KAI8876903.1 hypothetical protein K501DRAFT_326823 [Backusella circina FSU 941]